MNQIVGEYQGLISDQHISFVPAVGQLIRSVLKLGGFFVCQKCDMPCTGQQGKMNN